MSSIKLNISKPSHPRKWKYMENVVSQLNFSDNISVELLIAANFRIVLEPIEIRHSRNDGTYAFKIRLFWCVMYPVNKTKRNKVSCNQIAVTQANTKKVGTHFPN